MFDCRSAPRRKRSINPLPLTSYSGGPWDRENPCRPPGEARGESRLGPSVWHAMAICSRGSRARSPDLAHRRCTPWSRPAAHPVRQSWSWQRSGSVDLIESLPRSAAVAPCARRVVRTTRADGDPGARVRVAGVIAWLPARAGALAARRGDLQPTPRQWAGSPPSGRRPATRVPGPGRRRDCLATGPRRPAGCAPG
jgi:hypothetical protein